MKIVQGVDLLSPPAEVDAICITTNGMRKKDGTAVMGRGVALAAAKKWPLLPRILGAKLQAGNHRTQLLMAIGRTPEKDLHIVSLPTKNDWRDPSPWELVLKSIKELITLTNGMNWQHVWLTPPGCGNGGLSWDGVAKGIRGLLNERFTIIWR